MGDARGMRANALEGGTTVKTQHLADTLSTIFFSPGTIFWEQFSSEICFLKCFSENFFLQNFSPLTPRFSEIRVFPLFSDSYFLSEFVKT
jgi:hypothetical protein